MRNSAWRRCSHPPPQKTHSHPPFQNKTKQKRKKDITLYSINFDEPGLTQGTCPHAVLAKIQSNADRAAKRARAKALLDRVAAGLPCSADAPCVAGVQSCIREAASGTNHCVQLGPIDVHTWLVTDVTALSCVDGAAAHGADSFCGSEAVKGSYMRWNGVQDWVDVVANQSEYKQCPCSGTESCLTVTATSAEYVIKDEWDNPVKGVCYTLTPAMADLLERAGAFVDPEDSPEPQTNMIQCTTGGDASLVHGAESYCGWVTGGLLAATAASAASAFDVVDVGGVSSAVVVDVANSSSSSGSQPLVAGVKGAPLQGGMPCGKLHGYNVTRW